MGGGDVFDPALFVEKHLVPGLDEYGKNKIAQAVLSHPHRDHIAQCGSLGRKKLHPTLLTCPTGHADLAEHERVDWSRLGQDDPEKKALIRIYEGLYEKRKLPIQSIVHDSGRTVPNLEYGIYYINPKVCDALHPNDDNKYGNALSMVFYFRHGDHTILFPGDITPEGMAHILAENRGVQKRFSRFEKGFEREHPRWHSETGDQPGLKELLSRGLTVLVAPHHGLESCYSTEIMAALRNGKPRLNVLSERRRVRDGDGKTMAGTRRRPVRAAFGLTWTGDRRCDVRFRRRMVITS